MKRLFLVLAVILATVSGSFAEESSFSPEQAVIIQKAYEEAMSNVIRKKTDTASRNTKKAAEEYIKASKETQESEKELVKSIKSEVGK